MRENVWRGVVRWRFEINSFSIHADTLPTISLRCTIRGTHATNSCARNVAKRSWRRWNWFNIRTNITSKNESPPNWRPNRIVRGHICATSVAKATRNRVICISICDFTRVTIAHCIPCLHTNSHAIFGRYQTFWMHQRRMQSPLHHKTRSQRPHSKVPHWRAVSRIYIKFFCFNWNVFFVISLLFCFFQFNHQALPMHRVQ